MTQTGDTENFVKALSIRDLLEDTKDSYMVPIYQRQYAWEELQVEDLLNDLIDYSNDKDSGDRYLLGQIILAPSNDPHYTHTIVDGQQRLTSIYLMLLAAQDFLVDNRNGLKSGELKNLRLRFQGIFFFFDKAGQMRPRLQVTKGGQTTFLNLLNEEKQIPDSTDMSAINLKANYNYLRAQFSEKFSEKPHAVISLLQAVFLGAHVIRINLMKDEQALEFFERTNDRGLSLSQSDLMKNLLFSKVKGAEYESVSEKWSLAINNLSKVPTKRLKSMDFSLKAMLAEETGESVSNRRVFREWRKLLQEDMESEAFLNRLIDVSADLLRMTSPNSSDLIGKELEGSRFLGSIQHWTLTSATRNHSDAVRLEAAKIIEARTVLSSIIRERSQDFEKIISPWAKKLSSLKSSEGSLPREVVMKASKSALSDIGALIKTLDGSVKSLSYDLNSNHKRIRLVLAICNREKALRDGLDSGDMDLERFLSSKTFDIEHIEPSSSKFNGSYSEEDEVASIDSMGNLTLWYKKDNRGKGGVAPQAKAESYSKSGFILNHSLRGLEEWGIAKIESRQNELLELLRSYFNRVLG